MVIHIQKIVSESINGKNLHFFYFMGITMMYGILIFDMLTKSNSKTI